MVVWLGGVGPPGSSQISPKKKSLVLRCQAVWGDVFHLLVVDAATTVVRLGHHLLEGEGELAGGIRGSPGHATRLVRLLLWNMNGYDTVIEL